jgi:hypothetical protein
VLKYFHSVPWILHSMPFFLLRFPLINLLILISLSLYVICFFSLTTFSILSLFSVLVVSMIICHGEILFWSSLFDVL